MIYDTKPRVNRKAQSPEPTVGAYASRAYGPFGLLLIGCVEVTSRFSLSCALPRKKTLNSIVLTFYILHFIFIVSYLASALTWVSHSADDEGFTVERKC